MSRRDKTKQRAPDKSLPGYCNICNQFGKLTLDHVPPKGSVQLRASETAYFLHALQGSAQGRVTICGDERLLPPRGGRRRSQNGVKFRTICATCNNARLGAKYDPELKRVANVIGQLARAQAEADLRLPPSLRVSVRTHYLIRGIIGHLLAAVEPRDRSKPRSGFDAGFHRHLREYFLDESIPLPKTVRVYYWLYPTQDRQVIINGLALQLKDGAATFIVGSLVRVFPGRVLHCQHRRRVAIGARSSLDRGGRVQRSCLSGRSVPSTRLNPTVRLAGGARPRASYRYAPRACDGFSDAARQRPPCS